MSYNKEYYLKNKEKINKVNREYYKNNKERLLKLGLEWKKNNPDKRKKHVYNWREKNPEKYLEHMLKRFNLTLDQYKNMLSEQSNVCKICMKPEIGIDPRNNKIKRLSIDHNHNTGKVRGLLCQKCNTMIGFFNEDINILKNAIKYLEEYND